MSNCILEQILNNTLKNIKFINMEYKYKGKAYNPIETLKLASASLKNLTDINIDKLKSIIDNLDLDSQSKMSTFLSDLKQAKDINNNLDILKVTNSEDNQDILSNAIAINNLVESINEYINKYKKNNLQILRNNDGYIKFNFTSLARNIGRMTMEKQGLKYVGKESDNYYTSLGSNILNKLAETGIIDINDNDVISTFDTIDLATGKKIRQTKNGITTGSVLENQRTVTFNNNIIDDKNIQELLKGNIISLEIEGKNIKIDSLFNMYNKLKSFYDTLNNRFKTIPKGYTEERLMNTFKFLNSLSVSKGLNKLFTPSNKTKIYKDINNEEYIKVKNRIRKEMDAITMNVDNVSEMVNDLEHKPFYIHKFYLDILSNLGKEWRLFVSKRKVEDKPFSQDAFINEHKWLKKAFKLDYDSGLEELTESDMGKRRTRKDTLFKLLEELSDPEWSADDNGKFHIIEFRGRNSRIYNALNVLNDNSDKVLTRHIIRHSLEPSEIKLFNDDEKHTLTKSGAVYLTLIYENLPSVIKKGHYKLDKDSFVNAIRDSIYNIDPNKKINLEKVFNKYFTNNSNLFALYSYINSNNKDKTININDLKNIVEYSVSSDDNFITNILALKGLHEILTNKNGIVITDLDIETDAKSSGVTINIAQEVGSENSKAEDMLEDLGLLGNNTKFKDTYMLILNKGKSILGLNNDTVEFDMINPDKVKIDIIPIIDDFKPNTPKYETTKKIWLYLVNELNINERDLLKKPTMTVGAYSQSAYNSARGDTSTVIAEAFINKLYNNKEINTKIFTDLLGILNTNNNKNNTTLVKAFGNEAIVELNKKLSKNEDISGWIKDNIIDSKTGMSKIKELFTDNIASLLSKVADNVLNEGVFKRNKTQLQEIFNEINDLFGLSSGKFNTNMFYMADILRVYNYINEEHLSIEEATEKAIEDSFVKDKEGNYTGRIRHKYLQPLLSEREGMDTKTGLTKSVLIPNVYALLVSTTHSLDFNILVEATNTFKKLIGEEEFKKLNVSLIHDAVILPFKYQPIYNRAYNQAFIDINTKIDKSFIYYKSMEILLNKELNNDTLEPDKRDKINKLLDTIKKYKEERLNILNKRKEIFKNINVSGKIFEPDSIYEYKETEEEKFKLINKREFINLDEIKNEVLSEINNLKGRPPKYIQNIKNATSVDEIVKELLNGIQQENNNKLVKRLSNNTKILKLLGKLQKICEG